MESKILLPAIAKISLKEVVLKLLVEDLHMGLGAFHLGQIISTVGHIEHGGQHGICAKT